MSKMFMLFLSTMIVCLSFAEEDVSMQMLKKGVSPISSPQEDQDTTGTELDDECYEECYDDDSNYTLETQEEEKVAEEEEEVNYVIEMEPCSRQMTDSYCCFNNGPFLAAYFLCWRANNNATAMAYLRNDDSELNVGDAGYIEKVNIHYLSYKKRLDPGARVRLGYNLPSDQWDLNLVGTYFYTKVKGHHQADNYNLWGITPSYNDSYLQTVNYFNLVRGSWNFNYKTCDLELGKTYYFLQEVSCRPHLGVRGASLYHNKYYYYGEVQDPGRLSVLYPISIMNKNNFWGIGPRTGACAQWHLGPHFSLFGDVATALLLGKVTYKSEAHWTVNSDNQYPVHRKEIEKYYEVKPTVQLLLGFKLGSCFFRGKMFFGLEGAIEYNYYWDQNYEKQYVQNLQLLNKNPGAVDMLGGTLGAKLEF